MKSSRLLQKVLFLNSYVCASKYNFIISWKSLVVLVRRLSCEHCLNLLYFLIVKSFGKSVQNLFIRLFIFLSISKY